jgi:hypothetical protein
MSTTKISLLIVCISLILSSCSAATSPKASGVSENYNPPEGSRENINIVEAKKALAKIGEKNSLLALELAKLPELKKSISIKEVESLNNIIMIYEIDPTCFNIAFDKMYKEGIPETRKFCTPLQALFWLSGKVQFSKQNNPLLNYDLESLLNKAWGIHGIVLPEEDVKKILAGRVYAEDIKDMKAVLSKLSTDSSIFRNSSYLKEVQEKWSNLNVVTDRLNSPRLIFKYIKPNIYYPNSIRGSAPTSIEQTFKSRIGTCGSQALFVHYCLEKAGYDSVVIRYNCTVDFCGPKRERMSYTNPTPYHWTAAFKEGGAIYEIDGGRHYMGGPYKSYSEIAGGNPFVLKSWRDYK